MKKRILLLLLTLSLLLTASCNQGETPTTGTTETTESTETTEKYNQEYMDRNYPNKFIFLGPDCSTVIQDLDSYNALIKYDKFDINSSFVSYEKIQELGDFDYFRYVGPHSYSYSLMLDDTSSFDVYVHHDEQPCEFEYETEKSGDDLLTWETPHDEEVVYQLTENVYFKYYATGKFWYVFIELDDYNHTGLQICPSMDIITANPEIFGKYFDVNTAVDAWTEFCQNLIQATE
jgi:hypothetical protein